MYELEIQRVFHASHALRLYDGEMEEFHAHDWHTYVFVASDKLDEIGVVMDFHELERIVDEVLGELHDTKLNKLDAFAQTNPSAEHVAQHIYKGIAAQLPAHVKLTRVTVTEASGCKASYLGKTA